MINYAFTSVGTPKEQVAPIAYELYVIYLKLYPSRFDPALKVVFQFANLGEQLDATVAVWTVHITIDAPQGVPGVSKIQNIFLEIKLLSFWAQIDPKIEETVKIAKKMSKIMLSHSFSNIRYAI